MERTARMVVLAPAFQLYPRVDKIDDVGSCQQVIDENAWIRPAICPKSFSNS